jgi:hypothetical protein
MWAAATTVTSPASGKEATVKSSKAAGEKTHLGMTAPISLTEPVQSDLDRTEELVKALEPHGVFESEEGLNHRMEVSTYIYRESCSGTGDVGTGFP